MRLYVRATPEAEFQIMELGHWWRINRTAAPTRFHDELEKAYKTLSESPGIGSLYPRKGIPGLRRYKLNKTPYHVYYVPRAENGELVVMAVWSGMRRRGPPLRTP